MASVRCERCGRPRGTKRTYVGSARPIGYAETAVVGGRAGCDRPGLVWLDSQDQAAYERGERVFVVPNAAVKIRVE
jgi:hypothetical protein